VDFTCRKLPTEAPAPAAPAPRPPVEADEASPAPFPGPPPPPPPPPHARPPAAADGHPRGPAGDGPARPLTPLRAYLAGRDLPPNGIAAYGVIALRARPTPDTRPRLARVCEAFRANIPRQRDAPASLPKSDQMLSVWPVDDAVQAERLDTCDFALDHYDLLAGQSAIRDAQRQTAELGGEGPFLLGWSPSSTRGQPDKLVMVVNLSGLTSSDSMDAAFRFWVEKVVEDPAMWRGGFSREKLRYSIRDFLDRYGDDLVKVVTIVGLKPSDDKPSH
jgi:hypothetical protein